MTHPARHTFLTVITLCLALCSLNACAGTKPEETASEPGAPSEPAETAPAPAPTPAPAAEPAPAQAAAPEPAQAAAPAGETPSAAAPKPEQAAEPKHAAESSSTKSKQAAQGAPTPDEKPLEAHAEEMMPAPTPTPTPAPTPTADTAPCGDDGQPMCPLQAFMESKLQKPFDAKSFAAIDPALARVATFAPDAAWNSGTPSWTGIVATARTAAKAGDEAALKQSCKDCHKAFRSKYKASYRKRPLP